MWIDTHDSGYVNTAHLRRIQVTDRWKGLEGRWQVRGFFDTDGMGSMGIILGIDFDTEADAQLFAAHAMGLS